MTSSLQKHPCQMCVSHDLTDSCSYVSRPQSQVATILTLLNVCVLASTATAKQRRTMLLKSHSLADFAGSYIRANCTGFHAPRSQGALRQVQQAVPTLITELDTIAKSMGSMFSDTGEGKAVSISMSQGIRAVHAIMGIEAFHQP
jgi:hypothetical protein